MKKLFIALIASVALSTAAIADENGADYRHFEGANGLCYELTPSNRVQHIDCGSNKWPRKDMAQGGLARFLVELGSRYGKVFKDLEEALRALNKQ